MRKKKKGNFETKLESKGENRAVKQHTPSFSASQGTRARFIRCCKGDQDSSQFDLQQQQQQQPLHSRKLAKTAV
jgi:hypothetical protein